MDNPDATDRIHLQNPGINTFNQKPLATYGFVIIFICILHYQNRTNDLNVGNKGFFLTFVTLPEAHPGASIDLKMVFCWVSPAELIMKLKNLPRDLCFGILDDRTEECSIR
jgi:hypothetical protein